MPPTKKRARAAAPPPPPPARADELPDACWALVSRFLPSVRDAMRLRATCARFARAIGPATAHAALSARQVQGLHPARAASAGLLQLQSLSVDGVTPLSVGPLVSLLAAQERLQSLSLSSELGPRLASRGRAPPPPLWRPTSSFRCPPSHPSSRLVCRRRPRGRARARLPGLAGAGRRVGGAFAGAAGAAG